VVPLRAVLAHVGYTIVTDDRHDAGQKEEVLS
jgi:hypothetical protein